MASYILGKRQNQACIEFQTLEVCQRGREGEGGGGFRRAAMAAVGKGNESSNEFGDHQGLILILASFLDIHISCCSGNPEVTKCPKSPSYILQALEASSVFFLLRNINKAYK